MKTFTTLLLLFTLFASCSKDNLEYQNDFESSLEAFQKLKKETNNSYSYKTTFGSWEGFSTEYTFEVINGIVTNRAFAYTIIGNTKRPETGWTEDIAKTAFRSIGHNDADISRLFNEQNVLSKLEWSETKEELGTKESPFNIWTLDEIYEKARTEWLSKRKDTNILFESKNNGIISVAGYVPHNCQDDCFVGIRISSITPLYDLYFGK